MKAQATPEKGGPRINRDIRANKVQLIDAEGHNRGVVEIAEAQQLADEAALDLVEIVPNAEPPVCKSSVGKVIFCGVLPGAAFATEKGCSPMIVPPCV